MLTSDHVPAVSIDIVVFISVILHAFVVKLNLTTAVMFKLSGSYCDVPTLQSTFIFVLLSRIYMTDLVPSTQFSVPFTHSTKSVIGTLNDPASVV
jgi:hypothetical protein